MADAMREALKALVTAYVHTLESARDRIIELNGECDPVDALVQSDPFLRAARAALAEQPAQGEAVVQHRQIGKHDWYDGAPGTRNFVGPYETRTLYTAPPAPSVPDAMPLPETSTGNDAEDMRLIGKAMGWNLCRAAMLAAAPEVPRG